jgi:hypothetical protein
MNRILRLYPLYVPVIIITYVGHQITFRNFPNEESVQGALCDTKSFVLTLLMVLRINPEVFFPTCAGIAWSVQVDFHGYIATTILFAVTYHVTYVQNSNFWYNIKKCILITWYCCSVYNTYLHKPYPSQWGLSDTTSESLMIDPCGGFDALPQFNLPLMGISKYNKEYNGLYQTFNFMSSEQIEARMYCNTFNVPYISSITQHGSSYMLGSLLYLNLYQRQQQQQQSHNKNHHNNRYQQFYFYIPFLKIIISFFLIYITQGVYTFAGLPAYLFLDGLLSMTTVVPKSNLVVTTTGKTNYNNNKDDITNNVTNTLLYLYKLTNNFIKRVIVMIYTTIIEFLSHRCFIQLSPYTYGIYLYHMLFLYPNSILHMQERHELIQTTTNPNDVCNIMEHAGYGLNLWNLLLHTIIAFTLAFIIAILLNKFIETPIHTLRRKRMILRNTTKK